MIIFRRVNGNERERDVGGEDKNAPEACESGALLLNARKTTLPIELLESALLRWLDTKTSACCCVVHVSCFAYSN